MSDKVFKREEKLKRPFNMNEKRCVNLYYVLEGFSNKDLKATAKILHEVLTVEKHKRMNTKALLYVIQAYIQDMYSNNLEDTQAQFFYEDNL